MSKKKDLSILFIGNSHTYFNDMPLMVKRRADEEDYNCRVTIWEEIRMDLYRKERT